MRRPFTMSPLQDDFPISIMPPKRIYLSLFILPLVVLSACLTVSTQRSDTRVDISENSITVTFPETGSVSLAVSDGIVKGIQRVTVQGIDVLDSPSNENSAPTASIITGGEIQPVEDWAAYLIERKKQCGESGEYPKRGGLIIESATIEGRFLGYRSEGHGIAIRFALQKGEAEWVFSPVAEKIGGEKYQGISWQLRLKDTGKIHEVQVEEPVVFQESDWRFQQRGVQGQQGSEEEFRLNYSDPYSMEARKYHSRQMPYFFLAGTRGSTTSFFDKTVMAEVSERREGERIVLRSRIPVRAGDRIETPCKLWLFRQGNLSDKWDALNEWTWIFDLVAERYRAQKGVKVVEPMPILFHQQQTTPGLEMGPVREHYRETKQIPPLGQSWFYYFANTILPKAQAWGVKTVEIRAALFTDTDHDPSEFLEGSLDRVESVCSPWGLEISPSLGGEQGLAYVCQKAHEMGIKVLLWSTPAHQSVSSPVIRENPNWLAWTADGEPERKGYLDITGMSLRREYFDFMTERYRAIRAATNFDGVWQDSFCSFGSLVDFSEPAPYPQLDETVDLQRALQEMGCTEILKEGCGPFGLSSRSSGLEGCRGKEYGRYYFLYSHEQGEPLEPDSYYRTLASKGVIEIRCAQEFEQLPQENRERIIIANRDYVEVLPFMKKRRLIGSGETWQGVEWMDTNGDARVLYAFEPIDWKVPVGARVRDVSENHEFIAET
ncbi:MAG TPA: hypothetical protein PLZ55_05380, partial [bacterium]|nr:hypothetical protein [bacterium]